MGSRRPAHHIVRGLCGAACTRYLKSPELCAEPTAQFAFHASHLQYGKLGPTVPDPESNTYVAMVFLAHSRVHCFPGRTGHDTDLFGGALDAAACSPHASKDVLDVIFVAVFEAGRRL